MYLKRNLSNFLLEASQMFPVITLTGPRQSGKTTLLRETFPDKPYLSFENPDTRLRFKDDPRGFLNAYKDGAIFDEFQQIPELPSYLQQLVDEQNTPGLYILSGSQQLEIMSQVSQSLAGRTAVLRLMPLGLSELGDVAPSNLDTLLLTGFYPRIYEQKITPSLFYQSYFDTYIQRDLLQLSDIKNLDLFQRFVKLCAGRIGSIFVASQLSNEIGVSVPTIQSWLTILQASYVVYLHAPYFSNISKRLIKAPKLYFYDVGLASYLLGIETTDQLSRDPLRGALFENLVIMDVLKRQYHQGKVPSLYYYRDSNQNEVDLLIAKGSQLTPVEIKSAATFHPGFLKGLHYFQKTTQTQGQPSYLVYSGNEQFTHDDCQVLSYRDLPF